MYNTKVMQIRNSFTSEYIHTHIHIYEDIHIPPNYTYVDCRYRCRYKHLNQIDNTYWFIF